MMMMSYNDNGSSSSLVPVSPVHVIDLTEASTEDVIDLMNDDKEVIDLTSDDDEDDDEDEDEDDDEELAKLYKFNHQAALRRLGVITDRPADEDVVYQAALRRLGVNTDRSADDDVVYIKTIPPKRRIENDDDLVTKRQRVEA